MNLNKNESNIIKKFNYRDLIIFLMPILIFSVYLFAYNPGILNIASFCQLHQIATGEFTNLFPIFHTFIEILCLKIYSSPISICILQILVFSTMWMIICKYHRDDSTKSSDEFFIQFFVTIIICLIPINAVNSITLSSFVLFSYALMFLCFLIKVMIDKNGQIDNKLIILLSVTIACVSGLNSYGIYIALISVITIIAYLFMKNTPQNTYITFLVISIVCIFLILSLNVVYDVSQDNSNIQINNAFEEGVNLKNAQSQFFSSINDTPSENYENVTSANIKNDKYRSVDSYVNQTRENIILNGLFNNPLLYMIFSIVILGFIYFITKKEEIFLVFAPNLLNIIIDFITGQNNLYSNLLVFYLIMIIFISLWFKLGLKTQDIQIPTMTKQEKIENYENKHNYQDIESELENLTLENINSMLNDINEPETQIDEQTPQDIMHESSNDESNLKINNGKPEGKSDLVDEILKEIKTEKK